MDFRDLTLLVSVVGNIAVAGLAVWSALRRAADERQGAELKAHNVMLQAQVDELKGLKRGADDAALEALRLYQNAEAEAERARVLMNATAKD